MSHPRTVTELLRTFHQRVIHSALSKALVNANLRVKFLAIASLSLLSRSAHIAPIIDDPRSLFEGIKGAKVLRLSFSTVLSVVTQGNPADFELIKLCSAALEGIHAGVFAACASEPAFQHHISRLRGKAEGHLPPQILPFVTSSGSSF
jgi:hypothetical protein